MRLVIRPMKNLRNIISIWALIGGLLTSIAQEIVWDPKEPFISQNIIAKTDGNPTIIHIQHPIKVQDTVLVPQWATLNFHEKGRLVILNDSTRLQINGPIIAPKQQIFNLSAKGVVSYRYESVSNIKFGNQILFYPEWWGVFPGVIPGQNGDPGPKTKHHSLLKEMMLDIGGSGGGTIQFSEGVYYIRDIVVDFDNITVTGKGEKTILRFDRENYGFSTRRGGIFTIQGPTKGKYYSKNFPEGIYVSGNFTYDIGQKTIENIVVKDLVIEWNEEATIDDPAMNGLTVVNAKNVLIDNVHVNLFGSNRAFYIGTVFDGDVCENITIKNSSCEQSRTGVFLLHGYDNPYELREKMAMDQIVIENNHFKVVPIPETDVKNEHLVIAFLDKYSSGIYFIGNEYTSSFEKRGEEYTRTLGKFLIKDNIIENADFGIRSWLPGRDENKRYIQDVSIVGNIFKDFHFVGIFSPFEKAIIKENQFISKQVSQIPLAVRTENEEGYVAAAIHVAKAPWKVYRTKFGPENVVVSGNEIEGCYLGVTPILLQPNNEGYLTVRDNNITYDSSCSKPTSDIEIETNRREYRTKRATVEIGKNKVSLDNQTPQDASIFLNVRREKFITLIEEKAN